MRPSILQLFVPRRGGLYRRASRLQYHVSRATPIANHGGFHSKTSLEAGEFCCTNSANGASSKTARGWPKMCFMITSSRPSITKYRDILGQLPKILNTSTVDATESRNPAIVILATPTFATWLENRGFMCKVLETIFPARSAVAEGANWDVTVLVAVVDGLPPKRYEDMEQITEGFAFLPCDHRTTLPELWQHDDHNATDNQSIHSRSSITFRIRSDSSIEGRLDIGVPLANTIFRNGRTSTLIASSWRRTGAMGAFEEIHQLEKISATIYPAPSNSILPLGLEIPLIPLTPPRRVVSGLGNILRQVSNAEGNIVSASQELEASVDSYLQTRSLDKQTVTVWALIIPDSIFLDRTREDILAADPKQIRASWTHMLEFSMRSYVGDLLQQGRGATLHRVLSGGGGWGLKQGLLSLDPETTLLNSTETSHNFDSSDSVDNNQIQALGNIAKPGFWVQFLISHSITPATPLETVDLDTLTPGSKSTISLSFGCTASTVDDIPQSSADPSAPSKEDDIQPVVSGYYGHFGAMSEAGIFIRIVENGVVTGSKIDVPNSEFRLAVTSREE